LFEEEGFKFTIDKLEKAITDKTRAIIINSPSNPTGMIYSEEELRAVADLAMSKGIYIISMKYTKSLFMTDTSM